MLPFKSLNIYCFPIQKVVEATGGWRKGDKPGLVLPTTQVLRAGKEVAPTKTEEIDHRWRYCESEIMVRARVADQIQCCRQASRLEIPFF